MTSAPTSDVVEGYSSGIGTGVGTNHQHDEKDDKSLLHPDAAHVDMDSPHNLIVWRPRRRHAPAHKLDDEGHEVERDKGEREGRRLDAE